MADFDFDLFVAQRAGIKLEWGKLSVRFVGSVGVDDMCELIWWQI